MSDFFNPISIGNEYKEWNMKWDANHVVEAVPKINTTFDCQSMREYCVKDFLLALEVCKYRSQSSDM